MVVIRSKGSGQRALMTSRPPVARECADVVGGAQTPRIVVDAFILALKEGPALVI